jgi:hypothetical protein
MEHWENWVKVPRSLNGHRSSIQRLKNHQMTDTGAADHFFQIDPDLQRASYPGKAGVENTVIKKTER